MQSTEVLKEYHRVEVDARKVVYDVNELLVFEVDDAVWDYYDAVESGAADPREVVARSWGEQAAADVVDELRAMGLLVPPEKTPEPLPVPEDKGMCGVTLNVMHGCNLACTYCFAQQGDYGLGTQKMSSETARVAVDWLARRRGEYRGVRVGFFGGEPMLNMKAIHDTVDYATEQLGQRVKYHITTNGTRLDEANVEFIAKNKIDVQVSLDGVAAVNDRYRPFKGGGGSHEAVASGVARLKAATGTATLRGTIPAEIPEFGESLWHMIEDLGATNVGFEPAEVGKRDGVATSEAMERIKQEWERIAAEFEQQARQGKVEPVGNLLKILTKIHSRKKTVYGCTAGHANVAVDPRGDIYPCHRFVGEDAWKMGNVHEGSFDEGIQQRFAANTVDSREPCRSCWVRYTCGGRCAHEAKEATGSITDPDPVRCDLIRHLTELCLKLYVRLLPQDRDALAGFRSAACSK
jgi:uncharacterized protein